MTDLDRFARLGIRSEADLLLHLPLRYEDETRITPIASARPGDTCQVCGEIVRSEVVARGRRTLAVELDDGGGRITLRFLNFYGSQVAQLAVGRRVRAYGDVRGGLFGVEIVHPRYRMVSSSDALPTRLTPVYPTVAGIGQATLRGAILEALSRADWADTVEADVAGPLGLAADAALGCCISPRRTRLSALEDRSHPAWRRLIFEELLAQQLSLKRARAARARQRAAPLSRRSTAPSRLLAALPFG